MLQSFAEILSAVVWASGKSLGQIARNLEAKGYRLNKSTLSRWMNGEIQPSAHHLSTLHSLADVLDMPPSARAEFSRALNRLLGVPIHARGSAPLPYRQDALGEVVYFAGREAELHPLIARLDQRRSFAITGLGGVGKTTLARQLLHLCAPHFTHGSRAVRLYPHFQPADVVKWAAHALGIQLPEAMSRAGSLELALEELRGRLAGADVLFLLDDVGTKAQIEPLIQKLIGVTWLLTSRQRLAIEGVESFELDLPVAADAAQMFLHYAEIDVDDEQTAFANRIVSRLGCLPIALRSAAGLLRASTVADAQGLLSWLDMRGLAALHLEHAHLPGFFEHFVDSQPIECRAAFDLCGVFARPRINRALFKSVANDLNLSAQWLGRLYDLSVVRWMQGEDYFELHPLVHEYARERLQHRSDRQAIEWCVTRRYADFAVQHNRDYNIISEEWENILAAVDCAYQAQEWTTLLRFYSPVSKQLWVTGDKEGYQQFEVKCLTAARAVNDWQVEAGILSELGWVSMEGGALTQAAAFLEQAQTLWDAHADQLLAQARVRRYRAVLALLQGQYELAGHWVNDARDHMYKLNLPVEGRIALSLAMIHSVNSVVSCQVGNYALAEAEVRLAIDLCKQAGAEGGGYLPGAQLSLGDVLYDRNDTAAARAAWLAAASFDRPDFVEDSAVAGAHERLARLAALRHDREPALTHAHAARQWYARRGLPLQCHRLDVLIQEIEAPRWVKELFTTQMAAERILRP